MKHRTEHLIESYFAGTLTEDEQIELKALLAADKEAAAEFSWQQKLAQDVSKLKLSGSIRNDQWRESTKPPFRTFTLKTYLLAAAAAIALVFTAYHFYSGTEDLPVNSMAGGFEHYPNKMKFKNLGGNTEEIAGPELLAAFEKYDQKQYDQSAALLTELFNSNPDNDNYRFYLGVSFSGVGNDFQAVNVLLPLTTKANSSYATPACYYVGVGFAHVKDKVQAKKYLKMYLDAPDGVMFKKQAKQLLNALE
ncbi:MAG: hypothetical protein JNJ57_15345 [Saprospiraceae bacterium]|nr:hypothetical protein [Saprospiraceae bacterium]